jgi:hypothetical protein
VAAALAFDPSYLSSVIVGRIAAALNTDTSRSDLFRQVGGGAGHHETRVLVARAAVQFDRALDVWGAGEAGGFAPLGGFAIVSWAMRGGFGDGEGGWEGCSRRWLLYHRPRRLLRARRW